MIKKIFFSLAAIIALASCTGDEYTGWLDPQSSDPEGSETVEVTVAKAADIDFANISDLDNTPVQLFIPTVVTETSAETEYKVTLYNDDKTKSTELTADENGNVTAAELKAAIEAIYGKAPTPRNVQMDIAGYTTIAGISVKSVATSTLGVTLVAPFIDSAYYLVGDMFKVVEGNDVKTYGWDKTGAHIFTHIGSGDVYDNPEFQIVFKTTADNQYWKIIPKNNYDGDFWKTGTDGKGVVGTVIDGDDSMEGNLTTNNPQAGKIAEAGIYRMTINMMEYTYKIEKLNFEEYIWIIGAVNGTSWNPAFPVYGPNFDGKYEGYYYLSGDFKFRSHEDSWDAPDWGIGASEGTLQAQAGNIPASAGFYVVNVDLGAMTYKLTKIEYIDMVGGVDGSASDWSSGPHMTYNTQKNCWEADVTLTGAFKFRGNGNWGNDDGNFGGTVDNIINGSNDNITPTLTGDVHVELYLKCNGKSYATIVAR